MDENIAKMMTYQDYRQIIYQIQRYGDACELFGFTRSEGCAADCRKQLDDLKSALMEFADKRTVPPTAV